jgi:hypothetical protein
MDLQQLAVSFTSALKEVLEEDEFDVVLDSDGELNVSTDDWTIHVEDWPDGPAWIAIDEEPENEADYPAALSKVASPEILAALAKIDSQADGGLVNALVTGGDPFSQTLVKRLEDANP